MQTYYARLFLGISFDSCYSHFINSELRPEQNPGCFQPAPETRDSSDSFTPPLVYSDLNVMLILSS